MFGKLPELFSRNFAIAFFLPVAAFLSLSLALANEFGYLQRAITQNTANQIDILIGTTVLGLISWFGGIILLVTNRDIIRILEGYGRANPLRIFSRLEQHRYHSLQFRIEYLDAEYAECLTNGDTFPPKLKQERNTLMRIFVERFPFEKRWLLPTSFGNAIRAFEIYPRRMYGIDSIPSWNRLLSVVPKDYRDQIDDAKAYMDFWVNIGFLSILFLFEYVGIQAYAGRTQASAIPLIAVAAAVIAYSRAVSSAVEWGDFVKSAYDIYLPALGKKMGFGSPADLDAEKQQWERFSQALIYSDPDVMPPRTWPTASNSDQSAHDASTSSSTGENDK